ncbi:ABC transporter ATP-binding protein [Pseudodonghicola flavimaris]|uniref:ABC transporter ATP-binding protein n=1 Tax=Pseudodonghicola flavimaris TaxID=3050036 RepID=A0ABT7F2D2_9RHOB|nr:ABC transporter ATP-binding protein [Pseudodonghicola flavimaris]MDK3018772.1 ABC transporter ATP-binding protein [Pseudodonghicola flavimaris]
MSTRDVPLLEIEDLRIRVRNTPGAEILRGVSLRLWPGETLAVVGESGCGKSMTSLAVMGLLPEGLERTAGTVRLTGTPVPIGDNRAMRRIRAARIGMVFQEPMAALDPLFPVGRQVLEVLNEHQRLGRRAAWARVIELLGLVDLPDPERIARSYPHRLSGGQLQRVVIAMAIACSPEVLIADEPTTALDVTVQAQIIRLLKKLQRRTGVGIVLITHNLGLVAHSADRVMVMYAGRKVEEADTYSLFTAPRHPYTRGLLDATPNPERQATGGRLLNEIPGIVPSITDPMPGCRFAPRCVRRTEACRARVPDFTVVAGHGVACFDPVPRPGEVAA